MHRLFTLGDLRLESADGRILSRRHKPLILLAYLARRAPRAASRAELATLMWGERNEARARQSLRQALLELHRSLGEQLVVTPDAVRLCHDAVVLDAADFERDVDAGRNREAVARWSREFLEGADDRGETALRSWLEAERAGLRRRLMLACERLLEDAERRGAHGEAIAVARRWTDLTPLDEQACRRLILALRRDGRTVEALATHSSFLTRLQEELQLAPSRDFLRLGRSLDESTQPDRAVPDALPALRTSQPPFVGRQDAFAALTAAWESRGNRTATVAVLEARRGMGATRLCAEFAAWCRDRPGGAFILGAREARDDSRRPPHHAARAMLAGLVAASALGGISPESLRTLAFLFPELRERFPHLPADGNEPTADELAQSVQDALEAVAEDTPVLVQAGRLADLDEASRALLVRLAASVRGEVMLVLVVADVAERIAVTDALTDTRLVTVPPLRPLTVTDAALMLDAVATLGAGDRDALAELLCRDTGGIPRYLAPAIAALVDERLLASAGPAAASVMARIGGRPLPVPARVRATVQERMRWASEPAAGMLEAGVVLGVPFTLRDVERLLRAPVAPGAVEELRRDGWLNDAASGDGWIVAPPMLRRALLALVPPLRREALQASLPRRRVRRPRMLAAGIALGLMLAIAGVAIWRRSMPAAAPDHKTVAVFPFAVSGGPAAEFLRVGMVDLLSTSLDGAAGLRTLDPRVVIAAATATGITTPLTPRQALDVARRLGASHLVLGTIVSAGGRLHASAILYDVRRGDVPEARASAEGGEANLFDVVDRLTAQLAVSQGSASGERLTQLAAVTTTSLEALKAYLAGRNAYRANDLYLALSSYQRAVAADSTFALAWYGLASTASWMLRPDIERGAAAQAVRKGAHLSARDRALIEGFAAYSRGSADSAEHLARYVTETYDDIEGWVLLGEVLYHHNWKRGRSLVESREAWQRVLALDSAYWPALQHLAEVSAVEGRAAEADSLLARYERSVGAEHMMLASRAMRAYAYRHAPSLAAVAPELRSDRGFWLALSVWYVAVLGGDVDDGIRLARHLVDPTRPPAQQGFGHVLLAHLHLAQGRWIEARRELALARALTPVDALEYELLLRLAPFVSANQDELEATLAELERLPDSTADNSMAMSWVHTQGALHPLVRSYLAGMTYARRGDDAGRTRSVAALAATRDPTSTAALGAGFALSIRAEHERRLQHAGAALAMLERGARQTPFVPAWTSGFVSQAYERYVRAELLHELGRDDEALRWYSTFADNSPYDLVYLAPSLYRQGQIYDARGAKALAASRYARFLELWKGSDPQFAPLLATARARLALQR